jgi:uncharacterized protein DUF3379
MICEDARLRIGADPESAPAELDEHLRGCEDCGALRREMLRLNADIRRALQQPPDIRGAPARRATPPAWRQWALAAGVVLVTLGAIAVWLLRPSDTLARDVVAHVQAEPESWLETHNVSSASIAHALASAGVGLDLASDKVTYAQSCWFRGHYVPHLVVQTAQGPATVMILRHERVRSREDFREAGMTGVIVPAGQGSIAVLARGGGSLDELAGQVRQDVHWLPGKG